MSSSDPHFHISVTIIIKHNKTETSKNLFPATLARGLRRSAYVHRATTVIGTKSISQVIPDGPLLKVVFVETVADIYDFEPDVMQS